MNIENKLLPHNDGNQAHDSFIEAVKEIPEELTLLFHVANYQTEAHGEDHQPKSVDPIHLTWHRDHFLSGDFHDILCAICRIKDGVIHCHRHKDCPLSILGFELEDISELRLYQ